ncbi:hypothetical protein ABZP36_004920 [Zizania latifolia]
MRAKVLEEEENEEAQEEAPKDEAEIQVDVFSRVRFFACIFAPQILWSVSDPALNVYVSFIYNVYNMVDRFVESGMVVGLGSGLVSGLAIQYLGTHLRRGSITGILGIPSSTIRVDPG